MENNFKDKIFIEKAEKIRLIIQQEIGLSKVLDVIQEKYKAEVFNRNGEIIILVEEKTKEDEK